MSVSIVIKCDAPSCDEQTTRWPPRNHIMDTYGDLREATERQGWELTSDGQHWCPTHASPSLAAVIIREAINQREAPISVTSAKAAAGTLEGAFLMIPRDKIIHGEVSTDSSGTTKIVRYLDAR